jgi:O-antigen/teichoic acid export membrane protein
MVRNAKLVFIANALILVCGVLTSLLSAWALGPAGRGDLLVIMLWPPVCAYLVTFGLTAAHRYYVAKDPSCVSTLFSNSIVFGLIMGLAAFALAEIVVPHLVGHRSAETMRLVRIYLINIPAALIQSLMLGMLEGGRRFGWAGASRLVFFVIQACGYTLLWLPGQLTLRNATFTVIMAQFSAMLLALMAVIRELKPHWQPSWSKGKVALDYGLRYFPGSLADFTTMRLDQLLLGGFASSAAIGLYFVAVRISEITTVLGSAVADALLPEVAASKQPGTGERLLGKSFRLTLYAHLVLLVPLWFGTPIILRYVYGEAFMAATDSLRILLLASVVLGAGGIAISALNGFGYPGLSTIARVTSATVTVISLLILLPRLGIVGAALASLFGYSATLIVALFCLLNRRELGFWKLLKPRREDIPLAHLRSLLRFQLVRTPDLET